MKKIIVSIISFVWIGFIFINSSQNGAVSHKESMKFAHKFFEFIRKYININMTNSDIIVRKFAHGFEFMVLAIILTICLSMLKINRKKVIIYTLIIILVVACCDEILQLFIPGRTSNVIDVLIDFLGGTVGCIITSLICLRHYRG